MTSRRSFLRATATAISIPIIGDNGSTEDVKCGGCQPAEPNAEEEHGFSGEPDFTVESSEKTHRVYWKPKQHFIDHDSFSSLDYGYAGLGGDYVVLNEGQQSSITSTVVAHEVGHNLGLTHTEGSLMGARFLQQYDRAESNPLAPETIEVFEKMEDVILCYWDADDGSGRKAVLRLIAEYNETDRISRKTVLHGIRQYIEEHESSAYYLHDWDNFGDDNGVSKDGKFYRW